MWRAATSASSSLADEVDLGGADIAVAGELADLVQDGPVADGFVDRRLTQAMEPDAPSAWPLWSIPAASQYCFTRRPRVLLSRCLRSKPLPSGATWVKTGRAA